MKGNICKHIHALAFDKYANISSSEDDIYTDELNSFQEIHELRKTDAQNMQRDM